MAIPLSIREIVTRTIDAVPTDYGRVTMRSRLEADFARHLDARGVTWRYEPEIFGPRGAGYLPDFLLLSGTDRTYVELKPTLAEAEAARRRMEVIWDARPEAILLLVCAESNWFFAATRLGRWESWQEAWKHL